MQESQVPSTFKHRVHTFTSLLAALICSFYDVTVSYEIELYTILTETVREASDDMIQRVRSGFPLSERLSTLLETHLAYARARQNPFERLGIMWCWTFIELPVVLCLNYLDQLRHVVFWELKLSVRWWRCLQAHCQQALLIPAAIRARIVHELPALTDKETNWMVASISVLGFVANLLGVYGM